MQHQALRKTGLSALAVAAVLAFWPASSQAQGPGPGQGQERAGERPAGGEGRGGGQQRGGGGAQPAQRAPTIQAGPQAAPQMRQEMRQDMGQQRAPRQERAITQQRQMAPQQNFQRQQTITRSPQRYEQRQRYTTQDRSYMRRGAVAPRTQAYQSNRVYRDRGMRYRSRDRGASGFVFLGGPRYVVRGYGSGWCRGLHRGRHSAPRIGWHGGTHRGLFRCG